MTEHKAGGIVTPTTTRPPDPRYGAIPPDGRFVTRPEQPKEAASAHQCPIPQQWAFGTLWQCPSGHLWACERAINPQQRIGRSLRLVWVPAGWRTRRACSQRIDSTPSFKRARLSMASASARWQPLKPLTPPKARSGVSPPQQQLQGLGVALRRYQTALRAIADTPDVGPEPDDWPSEREARRALINQARTALNAPPADFDG